jgi:hypothetical protein
VFYAGVSGQIWNWYWDGSRWSNNALGAGEEAAPGTEIAAYRHPDGVQANVFYVGPAARSATGTGTAATGPTASSSLLPHLGRKCHD